MATSTSELVRLALERARALKASQNAPPAFNLPQLPNQDNEENERARSASDLAQSGAYKLSPQKLPLNRALDIALLNAEAASIPPPDQITLNEAQLEAVSRGSKFESFCLIGAAGTGKTTCQRELVTSLLHSPQLQVLNKTTRYLKSNAPGIAIVAFTRRAVRNIRKRMPLEIRSHCLTIHALLQYAPTTESFFNPDGELRERKVFKPTFTRDNLLPGGLRTIIVEEASMVSTQLFQTLLEALPYGNHTQFVFLGDLNQIPPVYGNPILAAKLLELPVVELTHVYRQALLSPILSFAHEIRQGKVAKQVDRLQQNKVSGSSSLKVRTWSKDLSQEMAEATFYSALKSMIKTEVLFSHLTPEGVDESKPTSILLCPWNKNFGNDEMNKLVGEALSRKFDQEVYEVYCGFKKKYLRVGEQVLVNKLDATVISILPNPKYVGNIPKPPSKTLTYHGHDVGVASLTSIDESMEMLATMLANDKDEMEQGEITRQASHQVLVRYNDCEEGEIGESETLKSAAEIMAVDYNYCLSIHKAQGSEWDKVFLLLHNCHMRMASRELLYTAVTRAKNELEILQPQNGIHLGSQRPRIKGVTLAEKLKYLEQLLKQEAKETLE